MDISFIIAVYNGEKEIQTSIESIQEWKGQESIEILIVDDGSTDDTAKICDEMSQNDSRIQVFHIENCGQGLARNYGIDHCNGKYVCFVDADDTVFTENVKLLYKLAEEKNLDIAYGSYKRLTESKEEWIHLAGQGFISRDGNKSEQELYHKIKTESSFGYLWNKIYRKAFLDQYHLRLDDIRKVYMEDLLFQMKLFTKHPVVYCVDYPIYCYHLTDFSTTRKADDLIDQKNLNMLQNYIQYLRKEEILDENMEMLLPVFARVVCWSLVKNISFEGISYQKIKKRLNTFLGCEDIQFILKHKNTIRFLWKIPSKIQSVFYTFLYFCMRKNWTDLIALIFCFMYPFMKIYISLNVK